MEFFAKNSSKSINKRFKHKLFLKHLKKIKQTKKEKKEKKGTIFNNHLV